MKNINSILFSNPNFSINHIDDLLDYQLCVTTNYETYRKLFAPLANNILWKFSYPIKFKL